MMITRRGFIKLLGGTLAGATLAYRSASAWGDAANKTRTEVDVGCGRMTNVDLRKYYMR